MSSLAQRRQLEMRYDGPIPSQHWENADVALRRDRGHASLLEDQALVCLDAAVRCETEIAELTDDLAGRDGAVWQREAWARSLAAAQGRLGAHIAGAAEAISRASRIRARLALPAHPLVLLSRMLGDPCSESPRAQ